MRESVLPTKKGKANWPERKRPNEMGSANKMKKKRGRSKRKGFDGLGLNPKNSRERGTSVPDNKSWEGEGGVAN